MNQLGVRVKMRFLWRSLFRTNNSYTKYCNIFNSYFFATSLLNEGYNWISVVQKLNFSFCKQFFKEDSNSVYINETDDRESKDYEDLVSRFFHVSEMGEQVLVVQPYIKWGPNKKRNTLPDLQLAESVALVQTLRNWKVIGKIKISVNSFEKKTFFGMGNLKMLKDKIHKNKQITAVFLSVDMLQGIQHRELEDTFGVRVYDRYMVVIQIFREHAVSKEAKLQVALAEIPYLQMKIRGLCEGVADHKGAGVAAIGGAGETHSEIRRRILSGREMKLKRMLEKVRNQRALHRSKRKKLEYPVVAVIGYTNAGKTSLIKALTGKKSLVPKDYLFATLDVTAHAGILPCKLEVLYIDTVGFISDIPTHLIQSFMATLEDALNADIIVHVCDVSHPDYVAQRETVIKILQSLNLSAHLLENIIVVGNKIDLLEVKDEKEDYSILVSSVTNEGLRELAMKIEKHILEATGRMSVVVRVPVEGEEMKWLFKCAAVTEMLPDSENPQYMLLRVVITKVQLSKFKHIFIENMGECQ